MNITVVLRKLGQTSPHQLEYGMQVQAPLNSLRLAYWDNTVLPTLLTTNIPNLIQKYAKYTPNLYLSQKLSI